MPAAMPRRCAGAGRRGRRRWRRGRGGRPPRRARRRALHRPGARRRRRARRDRRPRAARAAAHARRAGGDRRGRRGAAGPAAGRLLRHGVSPHAAGRGVDVRATARVERALGAAPLRLSRPERAVVRRAGGSDPGRIEVPAARRLPPRQRLLGQRRARRPLGRHDDGLHAAGRRADGDALGVARSGAAAAPARRWGVDRRARRGAQPPLRPARPLRAARVQRGRARRARRRRARAARVRRVRARRQRRRRRDDARRCAASTRSSSAPAPASIRRRCAARSARA